MHTSIHGQDSGPHSPASAEWSGAATAPLFAFFGQLRRVPIGTWLSLADADPHIAAPRVDEWPVSATEGMDEVYADRVARARLREIIEGIPNIARRIRSRIDHEIAIVSGIAPPQMVARMRRAARLAACALAARPWLSPEEFARLYRPFAELIPVRTLETQSPVG